MLRSNTSKCHRCGQPAHFLDKRIISCYNLSQFSKLSWRIFFVSFAPTLSRDFMINLLNHRLSKSRYILKKTKRKFLRSKNGFYTLEAEIQKVRRGSKVSRLFRRLFEQRKIKTLLGGTLAILVLGSSILSPQTS